MSGLVWGSKAAATVENPRVRTVRDRLQTIESADTGAIQKVFSIFGDRELVPEGGIIHVYGPAQNFFEWAVPLLVRPDSKIVVIETRLKAAALGPGRLEGGYETVETDMRDVEATFRDIKETNPQILQFANIHSATDLRRAIDTRVTLIEESQDTIRLGEKPVADFAMMIGPFGYHVQTENLKIGGVVWIARERANEYGIDAASGFGEIRFHSPYLGAYLPSFSWRLESGAFLSHSSSEGGLLLVRTQ